MDRIPLLVLLYHLLDVKFLFQSESLQSINVIPCKIGEDMGFDRGWEHNL